MNKRTILFSLSMSIAFLSLCSFPDYSGIRIGDCTGSPIATNKCNHIGCHISSTGGTTTITSIDFIDSVTNTAVTSGHYIPGNTYIVHLNGSNSNKLLRFGFQVAILDSTYKNAGKMRATDSQTTVDEVGFTNIIEQKKPMTSIDGTYHVSFNWIAPISSTRTISFYAVINAVNGNNNSSGDAVSNTFQTSLIDTSFKTTIHENKSSFFEKIYPNPCHRVLNIEGIDGVYSVCISDLMGRTIMNIQSQNNIDVSTLSPGIYNLRITKGTEQQTATFVKQ